VTTVVVVLGTDHHPFERLVRWADRWATRHPEHRVVVQHGHTRGPSTAEGVDFLDPQALSALLEQSDVAVTHGGPGTIMVARTEGRLPQVLARNPRLGEHVDGHQMRFARWAQDKGLVDIAPEVADLDRLVACQLRSPTRVAGGVNGQSEATARLAELAGRPASVGPVVYILGAGRSGSTLLERVLGQDPRVATLGEVHHLWQRGIVRNELCGCGRYFHDCTYWSEIGQRAFGGWSQVDLGEVRRLADRVDRQRHLGRTATAWPTGSTVRAVERYAGYYRRIYQAALDISGAEVVIDSGKHPSLALALSHDRSIDLRALHMVRDSAGVSYSWSKQQARPEARSQENATMKQYSTARSIAYWLSVNGESELLRLRRVPFARLRYEDFVSTPNVTLPSVWTALGLPGAPPALVDHEGHVDLGPNHTVAGNPSRFAQGDTVLRADIAWRSAMARTDRRQVEILTWPMRRRYGYRTVL